MVRNDPQELQGQAGDPVCSHLVHSPPLPYRSNSSCSGSSILAIS